MSIASKQKNQVPELLKNLEAGVRKLVETDGWKAWLDCQAKFHRYSFANTILILWQKPDATRVAGYRKWQRLGRQVRGGERGIAILESWRPRAWLTSSATPAG